MVLPASGTPLPPSSLPIAPTEEAWRAMTPAERERLLVTILDALSDPRSAMAEGRPHYKAKARAIDMLTLHFGSTGRVIYLAEEMAVLYPGEEVFSPDILAVLDVPQPEDDPRMAWVVADEGRGLSLVLEVLHQGDRNKDLVANVERYARLGIPEYFVYDRLRQQVHGYRLPAPDATRYQRIVPQMGRHASAVLGLDLAVTGERLQFFQGMAELFGTADLIGRLKGMMESLEARAEQAQAQAEQAQAQAAQAQAQAEQAMAGLREAILATLSLRGIACPDEPRARLLACQEPATLQRWLLRAMSAGSLDEILAG
ncbi:Uma2 family endonuclease [Sorangium sp. So ce1335]|uniref:Uma2 family endonuclease n=1 Tax=Sorangium sp. So ce1335 TaxID=3133335 RepID=UPI003F5FACE3